MSRDGALAIGAIVLLVVLLVATYVRLFRFYRGNLSTRFEIATVSDVYSRIKTGDIFLCASFVNGVLGSISSLGFFSHGGMFIREPDGGVVIAETTRDELAPGSARVEGPTNDDVLIPRHAVKTPALTRMRNYRGTCFLMRLSSALPPDAEARVAAAARETGAYPSLRDLVFRYATGFRLTADRHCFELVAHLLDAAGLAPEDGPRISDGASFKICRDVAGLAGRRLVGPGGLAYTYLPPLHLAYDF